MFTTTRSCPAPSLYGARDGTRVAHQDAQLSLPQLIWVEGWHGLQPEVISGLLAGSAGDWVGRPTSFGCRRDAVYNYKILIQYNLKFLGVLNSEKVETY